MPLHWLINSGVDAKIWVELKQCVILNTNNINFKEKDYFHERDKIWREKNAIESLCISIISNVNSSSSSTLLVAAFFSIKDCFLKPCLSFGHLRQPLARQFQEQQEGNLSKLIFLQISDTTIVIFSHGK